MKKYFSTIILVILCQSIRAQLYVAAGAILKIEGTVTLHNEDFIRSSPSGPSIDFAPGSNILFTGNADNIVSGYISFLNLEIAKEGTHKLSLQNYNEEVRGQMVFTSGLFDLNGNTLILGSTGSLVNENENSRIIGPSGGGVNVSKDMNQPTNVNPGNIGTSITSTQNLGMITINRGYVYPSGLPSKSVQRYYAISFNDPGKDNNLDATLRQYYFDAELNAADETKLVHWKFDGTTNTWGQQGVIANTTRNTNNDWVELSGINSLSTWTLAEPTGTLPVNFTFFTVGCTGNAAVLNWQTASEINSDHFEIQKSNDAITWLTIATQKAAGQSSTLKDYSYTDFTSLPSAKVFYRILSVDVDGRKKNTDVKVSACSSNDNFLVWPNPVQHELYVSLKSGNAYQALVQLIDNKGAIVQRWKKNILIGANQFAIDMNDQPKGAYYLVVNNTEGKKIIKIIKQ